MRSRYYDPEVGRFINMDNVMGNALAPLTQNLYAYVSNNPINFVDPSGHYKKGLEPGTEDWFYDLRFNHRWSEENVKQLQMDLNAWGFTDANGNSLDEDGKYGDGTLYAHMMYFDLRSKFLLKNSEEDWKQYLKKKASDVSTRPKSSTNNPSTTVCDRTNIIMDYFRSVGNTVKAISITQTTFGNGRTNYVQYLTNFLAIALNPELNLKKNINWVKYGVSKFDIYDINESSVKAADLGNALFGYIGKVYGLTENELIGGAQTFAVLTGFNIEPPEDIKWIKIGFKLFNEDRKRGLI